MAQQGFVEQSPPVRKMLVAARFVALLTTAEFMDAILAPRACTSIMMPSASNRRRIL